MRHFVVMMAGLLVLTGCVENVRVAQDATPEARKSSLFSKSDNVELHGEKSVKGEIRVAVPLFRVAFYTEKDAGASAGKGGTSVDSSLLGIDPVVFQQVADAAYQDFLVQLQAGGFEVLPYEAVTGSQAFQGMDVVSSPHTAKALFGQDAVYVAPTGMKLALPATVTGVSGAFSAGAAEKVVQRLVKELQVAVLDVTYYVDYLNTTSEGGRFSMRATVDIGQGIFVMPGSGVTFQGYAASKCVGYCPDMTTSAKLGQVAYSNEPVGELRDATTSAAKTTEKVVNAVSGLLLGTVRQHREYELLGDPQKYSKVAGEVLTNVNRELVAALATHR